MFIRPLKRGFQHPLPFMKNKNRHLDFPKIFIKRLTVEAAMLCVISMAGAAMESMQGGQGFLKLTVLCAACIGCHLIYMIWIILGKKYEAKEGEVIEIRIPKYGRKYREIYIKDAVGRIEGMSMEGQYGIRRGKCYRFYISGGRFIDAEEL